MPRDRLIRLRRGSGVPTAANWETGEPAFNPGEGRLYVRGTDQMNEYAPIGAVEKEIPSSPYSLVLGDIGRTLYNPELPFAAARTVTIPTDATTNFPLGAQIYLRGTSGAGRHPITVSPASGVSLEGDRRTVQEGEKVTLTKRAANSWTLTRELPNTGWESQSLFLTNTWQQITDPAEGLVIPPTVYANRSTGMGYIAGNLKHNTRPSASIVFILSAVAPSGMTDDKLRRFLPLTPIFQEIFWMDEAGGINRCLLIIRVVNNNTLQGDAYGIPPLQQGQSGLKVNQFAFTISYPLAYS